MLAEIVTRLEEEDFRDARCIVMDGEGWHRGVIGILASRIVDRTGKPAIVIAHDRGKTGTRRMVRAGRFRAFICWMRLRAAAICLRASAGTRMRLASRCHRSE